ncbi:TPA: DNA translocase FtsK [Vibrio vulnificus]|uniref:DNA translocase FtsK n=1 Tax=Vibrio vulnificus TaxID=672 RepID=UPI001A1BB663|nr:DNA translocase FtsK [Vibrio vulnificus]EGR0062980.1 DNA translocase FtsK [Vibrio vulnificus]EIJ0968645.1 DNA translocase FtsK 4TM domain-containing protein [Vibrio vulnificus]EIO4058406.1 DNA translocase FtsK 4TM domain-containing protein [Vibrio vulnificus]EIU7059022.1 DNA translocase FtsK 4TM domain-containing protein [Vibrio vulnificus]ELV8758611.1 DNA translocase FtsK 4TM domain-containing protein [Vibrio vulnificus]
MFKENAKKVQTIIKTSEEAQSSRLNGFQRLKECCLILGVLTSAFLSIALITFSPADPSWSQTSWGGDISNAGGQFGAWVADTLFFTFGLLAYLLPVLLVIVTWVFFRTRDEDEHIDLMLWGTRLLGLVILILTSCGLADINFDDIWYFSSGGVLGDVLNSLALPTLNLLGTTLVLLFAWGAGFTLLTGISWLSIVEWIGSLFLDVCQWALNRLRGEKTEVIAPELQPMALSDDEPKAQPQIEAQQDEIVEEECIPDPLPMEPVVQIRREYPIHMPQTVSYKTVADELDELEDSSFERAKKLNATIEELEQEALSVNDLPDDAMSAERARYNVADIAQVSAEHSQTTQVEHAQDFSVDVEEFDHVISLSELDKISEEIDEPVMVGFAEEAPLHRNEAQSVAIAESREPMFSHPGVEPTTQHTTQEESVELPAVGSVGDVNPEVEDYVEENEEQDQDVTAFQNMVSKAQQNMAATQNPFLMKQDTTLPVPKEPLPTLELLYHPEKRENFIDKEALEQVARLVESKLADYKITAEVVGIFPGPVITRFELDLAPGVKVSRISSLSMDLARSLSAIAVRVVEVIPGKPYVGLELPNMSRQTVYLSDVIDSPQFKNATSPTTVVLGQDIAGEALVADLAKMPHVLVAGTTGSGKSVGVNVMILSMLYKASPEDVRFIMIDPKMLELSVYEGIPHLLAEVVTDMKDASNALRWCVGEMERRYKLMSVMGVRNIKGFNEKLKMAADAGHPIHDPFWQEGDSMDTEPPLLEKLPYIVVVVDEFADLMMVVGKKVEELIARLAQKARAAGIHLILATQRPSVDVITGLIKANIPTRVAFTVSTKTDSRTILDQGGAESLLGMGDMLYLPPGSSHTIRVHGAFASDDDVHAVVNNWKARGKPNYIDEIISGDQGPESLLPGEQMESDEDLDPLFDQVVEHVVQSRRGSVSGVQRRFKIGYNRAARIVEQLEAQGIVSAPGHNGNREVLAPAPPRE